MTETQPATDMTETKRVDLRGMPMDPRHELLFSTIFGLQPGESAEVTNDHDPSGLFYRLGGEHPGRFIWTWLEQGPVDWRFRLDRTDLVVAESAAS